MQQPDAVIVTVLKSGGDFRPEHADTLAEQIRINSGGLDLLQLQLTDFHGWMRQADHHMVTADLHRHKEHYTVRAPLSTGMPGWWSVLEAFDAPRILFEAGWRIRLDVPFIYLDLDTVCVGDLRPLITEIRRHPVDRIACVPDIYRQNRPEMGVMGWRSPRLGTEIANRFEQDPPRKLDTQTPPGDWLRKECGDLLTMFDRWSAGVWSYKHDLRDRARFAARMPSTPPVEPGIVVFHGKPRPWHVGGETAVRNAIDALTGRAVADGT